MLQVIGEQASHSHHSCSAQRVSATGNDVVVQRQNQYARDDHEQAWQDASDRAPSFQQRWGVGIRVPPQRRCPRPHMPSQALLTSLHNNDARCESVACAAPSGCRQTNLMPADVYRGASRLRGHPDESYGVSMGCALWCWGTPPACSRTASGWCFSGAVLPHISH